MEPGILAASWNPDDSLLVLVTGIVLRGNSVFPPDLLFKVTIN